MYVFNILKYESTIFPYTPLRNQYSKKNIFKIFRKKTYFSYFLR